MPVMVERVTARPRTRRRVVLALLVAGAVAVWALYVTVPTGNEGDEPVDALVVLGTPAGFHGEMNPMQIWRVDEVVREWRAGRAPRIVFTGGASANRFVEAEVMARYARTLGVPDGAILEERRSRTTLENIQNGAAIVRAHGWTSVEVVSSRQHLARAAVMLERTGLRWRVHAAPTPGWPRDLVLISWVEEAVGTAGFRVFGPHAEPVLHVLAVVQQAIGWGVRSVYDKVEGWLGR